MGLADVDVPGFDIEPGRGEEGVILFRRFSIAASMLSQSAMSKMRVGWFGAEEGFYIRLGGTVYHACAGLGASGSRVSPSLPEEGGDRLSPYQYEGMTVERYSGIYDCNPHRRSSYPRRRLSPLAGASRGNPTAETHPEHE